MSVPASQDASMAVENKHPAEQCPSERVYIKVDTENILLVQTRNRLNLLLLKLDLLLFLW
jgi:hypothetical protein